MIYRQYSQVSGLCQRHTWSKREQTDYFPIRYSCNLRITANRRWLCLLLGSVLVVSGLRAQDEEKELPPDLLKTKDVQNIVAVQAVKFADEKDKDDKAAVADLKGGPRYPWDF